MGIHGATFSLLPKIDRGIKVTGILRGSTLCFHVLPRLYVIVACNISKYSANRTVEVETSGESKTVENLFFGKFIFSFGGWIQFPTYISTRLAFKTSQMWAWFQEEPYKIWSVIWKSNWNLCESIILQNKALNFFTTVCLFELLFSRFFVLVQ